MYSAACFSVIRTPSGPDPPLPIIEAGKTPYSSTSASNSLSGDIRSGSQFVGTSNRMLPHYARRCQGRAEDRYVTSYASLRLVTAFLCRDTMYHRHREPSCQHRSLLLSHLPGHPSQPWQHPTGCFLAATDQRNAPPSIVMTYTVIWPALSLAKKATNSATSSGQPQRSNRIVAVMDFIPNISFKTMALPVPRGAPVTGGILPSNSSTDLYSLTRVSTRQQFSPPRPKLFFRQVFTCAGRATLGT